MTQHRLILTLSAAALTLGACVERAPVVQPANAPVPTNAEMTFVDVNGCSWWVVGNASQLEWAPMTNTEGQQVCDEGNTRLTPPVPDPDSSVEVPVAPAPDQITAETAAMPEPVPQAQGTFFVQVATFGDESNASATQSLFSALSLPVDLKRNGNLSRLRLGPFQTAEQADAALATARAEGFADAFMVR